MNKKSVIILICIIIIIGSCATQQKISANETIISSDPSVPSIYVNAYKKCWVVLINEAEESSKDYGWWSVWHQLKKESKYFTTPHTFSSITPGVYTLIVYDPVSENVDPNKLREQNYVASDGVVIQKIVVTEKSADQFHFEHIDFIEWNCLSCPWVYLFDGRTFIRRSEILRDLIGWEQKGIDSILLSASDAIDGVIKIRLSEERDEITYISSIELVQNGMHCEKPLGLLIPTNDSSEVVLKKGDVLDLEFHLPTIVSEKDLLILQVEGYYEPDPMALRSYINNLNK